MLIPSGIHFRKRVPAYEVSYSGMVIEQRSSDPPDN